MDRNIHSQFLSGLNLFHDEPRLLLQDFVSEIHNDVAILRALGRGYRTPKEIAGFTGLNDHHLSMYLANLAATGFVERRVPVTQGRSSRLGRHFIVDPFLRFYFRFLAQRQAQLAFGVQEQALAEIKKHLIDFSGANTWEELCREWLLWAGASGRLPIMPDQVGSAWTRKAQVDVVGINRMEKNLILGECKWECHPIGVDVLKGLIRKTEEFVPQEQAAQFGESGLDGFEPCGSFVPGLVGERKQDLRLDLCTAISFLGVNRGRSLERFEGLRQRGAGGGSPHLQPRPDERDTLVRLGIGAAKPVGTVIQIARQEVDPGDQAGAEGGKYSSSPSNQPAEPARIARARPGSPRTK